MSKLENSVFGMFGEIFMNADLPVFIFVIFMIIYSIHASIFQQPCHVVAMLILQ
jgi:hypothetical protein